MEPAPCRSALRSAIILVTLFFAGSAAARVPARPNILVFLADDLGALDTAPYGSADAVTPNVSRLSCEGMAFEAAGGVGRGRRPWTWTAASSSPSCAG